MGSILKRIPSLSQLQKQKRNSFLKYYSQIYFELDEPDFTLNRKFNASQNAHKSNQNIHKHLKNNNSTICPKCGNTQFSLNASFCKICGYEVFKGEE